MQNNINELNSIRVKRPPGNYFNLTHDHKLSTQMAQLTPVMLMECVPGDLINCRHEALIRLAPMVAPMMHRVNVSFHTFAVPYRILWDDFEEWYTTDEAPPVMPFFTLDPLDLGSDTKLMDYMGLPVTDLKADQTQARNVSILPFVAYQKIYNEYYRDQNLVTEVDLTIVNGDNTGQVNFTELITLRKRAWEHDYFTSALPFAQKGAPVSLPIGVFNDVQVKIKNDPATYGSAQWDTQTNPGAGAGIAYVETGPGNSGIAEDMLYAETSDLTASSATINALRRAFRLQEFLELDARAGTRMTEVIWGHFGVKSSDARLQRPEYITGSVSPIHISEVLNTTGTEDAPQGQMAGHGIATTGGNSGKYFCEEPVFIITIMSVMPKTAYQQGIPKLFSKINNRYELYWPKFANLGEQEINLDELYAFVPEATQDPVFGYIPRYAEYRTLHSRVSGDFKTTLNFWHMGRIFDTAPALNEQFVTADPTQRVFAVQDDSDKLWCHVLNVVKARRPMPRFGTPSI